MIHSFITPKSMTSSTKISVLRYFTFGQTKKYFICLSMEMKVLKSP